MASLERLPVGPRAKAEIALGLRGGKEHAVRRHAQPVQGDEWFASGDPSCRLGKVSDRKDRGARNAQARRSPAGKPRDLGKHIGERHVLAAENIAFADRAAFERRDMAFSDIVDMDQIEARIHEAGHAAARRFDDNTAGRRRPHVARPDRRRGIDDHRGKGIVGDHRLDQPFGGDLAALVGADPLVERQRHALIRRTAIGTQTQRRHAAGIDNTFGAGAQRLLHDDSRALDVVGENLVPVARP